MIATHEYDHGQKRELLRHCCGQQKCLSAYEDIKPPAKDKDIRQVQQV